MDDNQFAEAGQLIKAGNPVHFEGPLNNAPLLLKFFTPGDGFVEDSGALYDNMSIKHYLNFFAGLSGTKQQLDSAVEQMHLTDILKKKISKCTDGEKIRIRIAREISKGADDFFLVNPISFSDEESRKIILGWMETFYEKNSRLATLSVSRRDTCICPGAHYEILENGIRCIDQPEITEENPDLPVISKISVSYNEKNFLFNPEEIDYVEANDGKVYVYVRREQYLGSYKLSELEEKLTRFGFFRCHRSYIVNMQKVTELVKWTRNSYSLRLTGYEKTDVPLSKGKIQELRNMYEF